MHDCIWYISKYAAPPSASSAGGRGYMIMREIARMSYRCVVVASDSNQLAEVPRLKQPYLVQEVDGLQLCWVRTLRYTKAKSLRRILSWLHFEFRLWLMPKHKLPAPDVIIVSSLSLLTILNGFLLRRHYRCRLVFEIRDIWPLTLIEEGRYSRWNPLIMALGVIERQGYRYADMIVGTMPNLSAHVAAVLRKRKRTHCIPMGMDLEASDSGHAVPSNYVDKYIPKHKFIVAHAGSIGIANALDGLFECAESMKSESGIHFLVVGEGDLRAHFQKKYAHLNNLTFAPRIPKNMVQSVLSQCDLCYFSVRKSKVWEYGQSLNKVIDYMLSGKPIVASYTGYPSMINDAGCGTFVPAGDVNALRNEIRRYASMKPEQREVIGRRGREWISANRSYKTLARDYLAVLSDHASMPAK